MKRGEFISLILGLLLGLGAGVTYSWVINPLSYNETTPNSLREGYRQEYLRLTALSFTRSGDLERARERLSSFDSPDLPGELGRLAQTSLANDRPVIEARALAQLAAALANPSASGKHRSDCNSYTPARSNPDHLPNGNAGSNAHIPRANPRSAV